MTQIGVSVSSSRMPSMVTATTSMLNVHVARAP